MHQSYQQSLSPIQYSIDCINIISKSCNYEQGWHKAQKQVLFLEAEMFQIREMVTTQIYDMVTMQNQYTSTVAIGNCKS